MNRIPEFQLVPVAIDEAARNSSGFEWASEEVGKRHKIGGLPALPTELARQDCKECGQGMTFWAQIDSVDDDNMIADCGMVFVFVCSGCFGARAIVHSA